MKDQKLFHLHIEFEYYLDKDMGMDIGLYYYLMTSQV